MYALIFDLDGVITDTAAFHYVAWKQLADELGLKFDRKLNERLKGVSRIRSLEIILEANEKQTAYSLAEKSILTEKKNALYVEMIKQIQPTDILGGILDLITDAKANGFKIALASSSKNAQEVLYNLNLTDAFDYMADAVQILNPKPAPDIFLECCEKLQLKPYQCIGIEDSDAGITAIKKADMFAVGINVTRENDYSYFPDYSVKSTTELQFVKILEAFNAYQKKQRHAVY